MIYNFYLFLEGNYLHIHLLKLPALLKNNISPLKPHTFVCCQFMSVYAGTNWLKPVSVYATDWHKPSLCWHFANPGKIYQNPPRHEQLFIMTFAALWVIKGEGYNKG